MLRKVIAVSTLTVALTMAVPSGAAPTPATVLGTAGAFVTPVLKAAPGDSFTFNAIDLDHSFSTFESVCPNNATIPPSTQPCSFRDAGTVGSQRTVTFASSEFITSDRNVDFYCELHPWMRGVILFRK